MKDEAFTKTIEFARALERSQADNTDPFMIFTDRANLIWANKAFLRTFGVKETDLPQCTLDFLSLRTDEGLIPISRLPRERLGGLKGLVQYRQHELALTFYLCVFTVGETEGERWYYALFKDVETIEQKVLESSLNALLKASLMKDNETAFHIRRVGRYARTLAEHLRTEHGGRYPEINSYFVERIAAVAGMHDVGKIGTPDSILTKRGRLTEEEYNVVKEHTINGAFILSSLAGEMARDIALFHHERWDGTGYPYGLKGTDIPLSARIVSLADVYDALRMKRYYKEAYTHERSKAIINDQRGLAFDPDLTDVFQRIHREFERIYNELDDGEPEDMEAESL